MNDLDVTGQIPELIGNWTKLTILKIQGTGWRGPIPSSFSNLTSLTESVLLRNNNLTGTIPSNFGEYSNLLELDVSYNDLSAQGDYTSNYIKEKQLSLDNKLPLTATLKPKICCKIIYVLTKKENK
ncbi:BnaC09g17420D [Brassica napus]|uniref:BnaC09g17420D protein n=1 Tax=Brassica napus TaxID=3708 RepID=A0A078I3C4_BRANA|nr:BnaC09g17420D [Brassica napus]